MKVKKYFLFINIIVLICLFIGCNKPKYEIEKTDYKILSTDGKINHISYKELFSDIEIIKLETSPEFLITNIDKAVVYGDTIIIFDRFQSKIGLFNKTGEFISLIGDRGEGPGEYISIYDFSLYPNKNIITLLSPYGELYNYTLTGEFNNKISLPAKHNYYACSWLNERDIILWSAVEEDDPGLTLYNTKSKEIVYEDWYNDRILDMSNLNPFFKYGNSLYFAAPLSFLIYEITEKKISISYLWDFNDRYISPTIINKIKSIKKPFERNQKLIEEMEKGVIEFPIFNGENKNLYYIAISKGIGENQKILNIFYNKDSGKSVSFRKFDEDLTLKPLFMNEEFILGIIPDNEYEKVSKIINKEILSEVYDNPILIKYYFK